MKKRILAMLTVLFVLVGAINIPAFASSPVNTFNVTVTSPVEGEKPDNDASLDENRCAYVADVEWEGDFDENGNFKKNGEYTVYVTVRIKEGLDNFILYMKSSVKVNGNVAPMEDISEDKQQAVINYTFKATSKLSSLLTDASSKEDSQPDEGISAIDAYEKAKQNSQTKSSTSASKSDASESMINSVIPASKFEWEVLRLTNIERAKLGIGSLSMPAELQAACDIRAVDLETEFSHTRPDGSGCFSVIPSSFPRSGSAENVGKGQRVPAIVINSWMNSKGHKENMTNWGFGYLGVGYGSKMYTWVQLFTNRGEIVDCKVSTEERSFSPETIKNVYLTLTDENGIVSYMPVSFEAMVKENNVYKPRINAKNLPEFINVLEEDTPAYVVPDPNEGSAANPSGGNNTVPVNTGDGFVDVSPDAYYAEGVEWAVENGITNGTSANTFSPDNTCTRAQIITFIWRAVGSPKVDDNNPFNDVKKSDYFYDAAIWAYKKGLITGRSFSPDTPCTRASTVEYLWKNANSPSAAASNSFSDVTAGTELSGAVSWAVANGITSGMSATSFGPELTCTRGQIVTFLIRAFK